jgi:RNA polymerase sigma-70 factor, ECF subfamily
MSAEALAIDAAHVGADLGDASDRLAALFDAHHQRLYRLARRLAASTEDARDLVQEAYLRAARSPRSVPTGPSSEEAWLVRVLINICRDRWRMRANRQRLDPRGDEFMPLQAPNLEAAAIARAVVWRALDTLAPRRRAAVVLYEIEGQSVADIARLLGIAPVTVRWHLSLGRREMAAAIRTGLPQRQPEAESLRSRPRDTNAV